MNSSLYDKKFMIPKGILKNINGRLYSTEKGDGVKRAKFLVKNGYCTYQMLKRLKNFFDYFNPNTDNSNEFELAGGEPMKRFVDYTLTTERSKDESHKKTKRDIGMIDKNRMGTKASRGDVRITESTEIEELILNSIAIIFDNEMRILLLKRSSYPDQWEPNSFSLPGGKIENGEDPTVAVRREVYEETGLDISKFIEKFIIQRDINNVEHIFITKLPNSHNNYDVKLDKENDGYVWVTVEEIKNLKTVPNLLDYIRIAIKNYN